MDESYHKAQGAITLPKKAERRNASFFHLSEIVSLEELSQNEKDTLSIFENKIGSLRYVTVDELADIFGISEKTVRHWIYEETIPCERLGSRIRFNPYSIARWFSERN